MLRFHPFYFILTILFLIIEIIIAVYVNDRFIRPFLGDMFVVILIYCFVRTFLKIGVKRTIILVLGIAFTVEALQYFDFIKLLGLQTSTPAKIILGNTFSLRIWGCTCLEDLLFGVLKGFIEKGDFYKDYISEGFQGFYGNGDSADFRGVEIPLILADYAAETSYH
jgi:uncharacterized membrane protein